MISSSSAVKKNYTIVQIAKTFHCFLNTLQFRQLPSPNKPSHRTLSNWDLPKTTSRVVRPPMSASLAISSFSRRTSQELQRRSFDAYTLICTRLQSMTEEALRWTASNGVKPEQGFVIFPPQFHYYSEFDPNIVWLIPNIRVAKPCGHGVLSKSHNRSGCLHHRTAE